MSYLVMETHRSYAIVLDQEGRFIKVANLGYEVGQSVGQIVEASDPKVTVLPFSKPVTNMLIAVACVLFMVIGSWPLYFQSMGTVKMEINPSVEISVNRLDYVIDLDGLNTDGKELIEDVKTFGKKVDEIANELTERAISLGFLDEGGEISLTVDGRNENWTAKKQEQLQKQLQTQFEYRFTINIVSPEAETPPESESIYEIPVPSTPVESQPISEWSDSDYDDTDYDDDDSLYGDSSYDEVDDGDTLYDDWDDDTNYDDDFDDDDDDVSDYSTYDESDYDDDDDSDYDD